MSIRVRICYMLLDRLQERLSPSELHHDLKEMREAEGKEAVDEALGLILEVVKDIQP